MVVMDKKDYIDKATGLLDQPAYRTIESDPTKNSKPSQLLYLEK